MSQDAFLAEQGHDRLRIVRTAIYPTRWSDFCGKYGFSWNGVPFTEANRSSIPKKSGIYCFHVGHEFPELPIVGLALYGGETVDLHRRYGEYMKERDDPSGRAGVRIFLNVFADEVVFRWAEVDATKVELRAIERDLNDALMPPYSHRDFTAEVKAGKDAWQ
jgi:hypothetical protein